MIAPVLAAWLALATGDARPRAVHHINLFSSRFVVLRANRVQCTVWNNGDLCNSRSSAQEDGFWPAGTLDNYVYAQGIQVAGIITTPGFPWAGDTVGAFFFDPRGDQKQGQPLTQVYDWLAPGDRLRWPVTTGLRSTPSAPGAGATT